MFKTIAIENLIKLKIGVLSILLAIRVLSKYYFYVLADTIKNEKKEFVSLSDNKAFPDIKIVFKVW